MSISHPKALAIFSIKHIATALKYFWALVVASLLSGYFEQSKTIIVFTFLDILACVYVMPKWIQFHEEKREEPFLSFGARENLYLQKNMRLLLVF